MLLFEHGYSHYIDHESQEHLCVRILASNDPDPDINSADIKARYMQFHPLAYMVKLKIEMSMADLIAKVARKKDPLPSIQPTSTLQQERALSFSRLASFSLTRGKDKIQPLPPVRNAVNFRQWSTATSGLPSLASRGVDTARNSDELARNSPELPDLDSSGRGMYMLQEVVVETEVVDSSDSDGIRPEEIIHNRLVDDPSTRQVVPPGGIWDGSASLSTFVGTGQLTDHNLSRTDLGGGNRR